MRALKRVRKPFALWPAIVGLGRMLHAHPADGAERPAPKTGRRLPAWSLLAVLLLGVGAGYYAPMILSEALGSSRPSPPDFTVGASPGSIYVPEGQLASFVVSMNSLNGFAGSVNLTVSVSPSIVNATLALNPGSVSLFTGSGTATLTIPVPMITPVGVYLIAITGASGRLSHSVTVVLSITVPPSPDFQIQASTYAMNITRGSVGTATITLSSIAGFSGMVNMTASVSPSSPSSPVLSLNPNRVTLLSGGTADVVLTIATTGTTNKGSYSIVVHGVSGSLSNTVTIKLTVQ